MIYQGLITALCILSLAAPAAGRYMVSCQKRDAVDPVTDMFDDCGSKWQRLTSKSQKSLIKAPSYKWVAVKTRGGHTIECRVLQKTDKPCPGSAPAGTSDKQGKNKGKPSFRPSRPSSGEPAIIDPEKISAAERMKLYMSYIEDAATRYRIPKHFIKGVIRVESNFNYRAKSPVGAMGLMQLMPRTAKALGVADPWDPRQNIMGGTKFLRRLANKYRGDMVQVLSAYNAGPGAVAKVDGTIPFVGAERYVRAVLKHYYAFRDEEERTLR